MHSHQPPIAPIFIIPHQPILWLILFQCSKDTFEMWTHPVCNVKIAFSRQKGRSNFDCGITLVVASFSYSDVNTQANKTSGQNKLKLLSFTTKM